MYQVIARKYRPQTFSDVVNQEHVKSTLENAIAQNRIAHGYIFSGQRGTGKTTVARIMARCLNCIDGPTATPCGKCASCLEITSGGTIDVIEIDAASNRGINEMRELRENVRYRPQRDRFKVFIIDEAHQITNEAFNALLKTIEEPPEWAVFMLCTTEAHKIPATIASRCQHFSFRSVDFDALVERMAWICKQEGIEADAESLAVLAQAGEGSVRDSLSALDQAIACCGNTLKAEEVRALLGGFSIATLHSVTTALAESNAGTMLDIVNELERNGQNLQHFSRELARYFRNLTVAKLGLTRLIAASAPERAKLTEIAGGFSREDLTRYLQLSLDLFKDLQASLQPRFHLELGLIRLVEAGRLVAIEDAIARLSSNAPSSPPVTLPKRTPPSTEGATALKVAPVMMPMPAAPTPVAMPSNEIEWKARLVEVLCELGLGFTADAVGHADIAVAAGEMRFTVPREYSMTLQPDDVNKAVRQITGRVMKVSVVAGAVESSAVKRAEQEDDVTKRALAHPEVAQFRELFGGSVRAVRNLKE